MLKRFGAWAGCGAIVLASVGCASTTDSSTTDSSEVNGSPVSARPGRPADPSSCPAAPAAGKLTLHLIPPSTSLDWSTPNRLLAAAVEGEVSGRLLRFQGKVGVPHSIGHVHVEMDCGAIKIPLTGQTGGDAAFSSLVDGFGMLLRDFEGTMDGFPGQHRDEVLDDLRLREASGLVTRMSFLINAPMCERLKTFHDAYVASRAWEHYSGIFRARRFEGAGCGIFGADVIDVGGLLRRSVFTPAWVRSLLVGSGRIANVLGADHYRFGSNLVAPGPSGESLVWPHGVDVPTSGWPLFPGTGLLSTWRGPEDTPFFAPDRMTLAAPMTTALPFSIYDPELMTAWAEEVWSKAKADGTAEAFETRWSASQVGDAHEITTDARCTMPQTIPFAADNDDLFKDSDAL